LILPPTRSCSRRVCSTPPLDLARRAAADDDAPRIRPILIDQDQASKLHGFAGLATLVELRVWLKDTEELLAVGNLLSEDHAAMPVPQTCWVREINTCSSASGQWPPRPVHTLFQGLHQFAGAIQDGGGPPQQLVIRSFYLLLLLLALAAA